MAAVIKQGLEGVYFDSQIQNYFHCIPGNMMDLHHIFIIEAIEDKLHLSLIIISFVLSHSATQ